MFIYTTLQPLLFTGIITKSCCDCNLYSKPYTLLLDCLHFTIVNRRNDNKYTRDLVYKNNFWKYLELSGKPFLFSYDE